MEKEESGSRDTNDFNLIKMVQEMMSGKGWQNKQFTVYVHTFGGYAMRDSVNLREARRFAEVLRDAGEEVDTALFYTAGYDSPMKFWNRRNEVMYLVPGNDL